MGTFQARGYNNTAGVATFSGKNPIQNYVKDLLSRLMRY
jgi:hypothetical protein